MKNVLLLLSVVFVFVLTTVNCSKDDDDNKDGTSDSTQTTNNGTVTGTAKYEIKSGLVTYNEHFDMGTLSSDTKIIYYFDNYGKTESREEIEDNVVKERKFTKDDYIFEVNFEEQEVVKYKDKYNMGIEDKFVIYDSYKTDSHWKILPDTTILGKKCQHYSFQSESSGIAVYSKHAGYKGLYFYEYSKAGNMPITRSIQKFEEGAAMPEGAFSYPATFPVKEISYK